MYTGNDRFSGNDRYSGLQGPDRFFRYSRRYLYLIRRMETHQFLFTFFQGNKTINRNCFLTHYSEDECSNIDKE